MESKYEILSLTILKNSRCDYQVKCWLDDYVGGHLSSIRAWREQMKILILWAECRKKSDDQVRRWMDDSRKQKIEKGKIYHMIVYTREGLKHVYRNCEFYSKLALYISINQHYIYNHSWRVIQTIKRIIWRKYLRCCRRLCTRRTWL